MASTNFARHAERQRARQWAIHEAWSALDRAIRTLPFGHPNRTAARELRDALTEWGLSSPRGSEGGSKSGCYPCGCRDCMEIAYGEPGELCHHCDDAGCEEGQECCAPGAYGGDEEG